MVEPVLVLDGVRKSFGALKVTDGVSLAVVATHSQQNGQSSRRPTDTSSFDADCGPTGPLHHRPHQFSPEEAAR